MNKNLLRFANRLADVSRTEILAAMSAPLRGDAKEADGSPVTAVDKGVELRLRELIESEYPEHGIVGEEHGAQSAQREYVWVIDPIDGTLPFLAGIPVFGTLIALACNGEPIIGVIDMPATAQRWVGCKGMPTLRNGTPVTTRACAGLATALLSTSNPDLYDEDELQVFSTLKTKTRWCYYGGSCLAYAQIASGRIDVGVDGGLEPFDYCACVPVIQGAGGVITDWQGRPLSITSGSRVLAAGDQRTHAEALRMLRTL